MELVYDGSWVAKPRASFVLEKNAQLLVYVFPMDMLQTYQGWLIRRNADYME
jgi:hypothetical protein